MTSSSITNASLALFLAVLVTSHFPAGVEAQPHQGFGATTPGGAGQSTVAVTNLNDSGPGSLREALSFGNRTVVFDVAGDIRLSSAIRVTGAFITIDGGSAPGPVTLKGAGLSLHGAKGAHDVIIRGLRIRDATASLSTDGITIASGAHHIVVDHVSICCSADGNLDITSGARDVTVSWSILAGDKKNMLVKYNPARVTLHHNLFIEGATRNPQVRIDEAGTPATDTTLDMRNNVVWGWSGYGTLVWDGPRVNIVNNYYGASHRAIDVWSARAYVQGNRSADDGDLDQAGNEPSPFPAPAVDTQHACTATDLVLGGAGARPLDAIDREFLSLVSIAACPDALPLLGLSPGSLSVDATVGALNPTVQKLTIANQGGAVLRWNATVTTASGGPWLSVNAPSGTAPSTLTVATDPTGLPEGVYEGTVTVDAGTAQNSPQSMPVRLVIAAATGGARGLEVRVVSLADDAVESGGGAVRTSGTALSLGRDNLAAFRFVDVGIPSGASIESAVLHLYSASRRRGGRIRVRYFGEDTGDSRPFSTDPAALTARSATAAFVDEHLRSWKRGTFTPGPDLRAIVQEIIDRADWVPGNSLTLFVADTGSTATRNVGAFETSPARAARLTITYQPPAAP